jgi:hypothetical protein
MKLLWSILFVALPAFTQSTNATLSGTVLDPAGARVPNVQVMAENVNTGVVLTTMTNEAGVYVFPSLQPGLYRLTAESAGFRKYILNGVTVEVAGRMNINISLELATGNEVVEVTAAPDSPQFISTASVGGVINGRKLLELPLPDRAALDLVLTQAGLVGDNFAGSRIGALNVTRDGINVSDQLINSGLFSVVFPSVDVIEEVRVITSPADAEFGRGSGQVQLATRSGTNEFHGSVYEFHRNTVLNANEWFNNLRGEPRDALILNQFGGRLGGPIVRQRTFFHFNYEGQRQRTASTVTATTYTQTARQGLFRFYPGAQNGNANASIPTVDLIGNPVRPVNAAGDLQSVNLFGRDPLRRGLDPSGTVQKLLTAMPLPNDFRSGDGLNTAGYTWRRRETSDFDQYNLKIDHLLYNGRHRLSFSFTRQDFESLNGFMAQSFPISPGGSISQPGTFYSMSVTSTLSPSIVNEFHAGAQRGRVRFNAPWELPGGRELMPSINGYQYLPAFVLATDPIPTGNDPQGRISPLYVYGDTFHWTRSKHAVKFGGELRFASSNVFSSFNVIPRVEFGFGFGQPPVTGVNSTAIPGLGANEGTAQALLVDLNGSVDSVLQAFNASGGANPEFRLGEGRQRTWRQRELSLFVQDDLRLKPSVTLNLGLRYEFYGVPWDAQGRTAGLVGGSTGLFGISGNSWSDLYQPGLENGFLTRVQLIGKRSPNPNTRLYGDDWNNFAPAVGVSWSIPYFGKDKTFLRAGYSIGYERNALRLVDIVGGDQPGLLTESFFTSDNYLDLTRIRLPLQPEVRPLETVPLTDRSQVVRSFDNNLRTPYIQNWNLTIQRELPAGFTLDVRYVGSKGTKLIRTVNLNEVNIFENGILEAFQITQAGGNAPLFDRLFRGFNLGLGAVDGRNVTGSASVRAFSSTRGLLANNNVGDFASFVNTASAGGERGGLLFLAGFPDNWIAVNPQFAGANFVGNFANSTYHSLVLNANKRFSSGWTLLSNYTWSRALGEEEGSSQEILNSYRNGRNRHIDKRLLGFHATHVFRNSGTWELPFGPDRQSLASSHGLLARLVGGWQIGGIFNLFSGSPIGLASQVTSFNQFVDNTPALVGPLPKNTGHVTRTDNGVVYFDGLKQVPDPAIARLTLSQLLNTRSSLKAITDSAGGLIAVNPAPGTLGSLSQTYLEGPRSFRFDVNLIKRVPFREGKEFLLRADAINVLNSPQFGDPNTDINSTSFGRITSAGGSRIVVLSMRVNF